MGLNRLLTAKYACVSSTKKVCLAALVSFDTAVAKVVKKARKHKVKVILQESYYPDSTSKKVAKLTKSSLVVLPGGVNFRDGETLKQHIKKLVNRIHAGF